MVELPSRKVLLEAPLVLYEPVTFSVPVAISRPLMDLSKISKDTRG